LAGLFLLAAHFQNIKNKAYSGALHLYTLPQTSIRYKYYGAPHLFDMFNTSKLQNAFRKDTYDIVLRTFLDLINAAELQNICSSKAFEKQNP